MARQIPLNSGPKTPTSDSNGARSLRLLKASSLPSFPSGPKGRDGNTKHPGEIWLSPKGRGRGAGFHCSDRKGREESGVSSGVAGWRVCWRGLGAGQCFDYHQQKLTNTAVHLLSSRHWANSCQVLKRII